MAISIYPKFLTHLQVPLPAALTSNNEEAQMRNAPYRIQESGQQPTIHHNNNVEGIKDERAQMRNALYRIQESEQQPKIQQFFQGNLEILHGRQVPNVSRLPSNLLYHDNHAPWHTGASAGCIYPNR